jgi:hypothetical protein
MITFLTTTGLNHYLEELLKNAKEKIILISPYIQLQRDVRKLLAIKKGAGLEINIVCRTSLLRENLADVSTRVFDCPTLHAKCYMNENEAIISSLNLYEFSQINNVEMGFHVTNSCDDEKVFERIKTEATQLCGDANINTPVVKNPIGLIEGRQYNAEELQTLFEFEFSGSAGIKRSAHGDLVLSSKKDGNPEVNGIIQYHGQNTGPGVQRLIYGNKALYDAYQNRSIGIYFLRAFVYYGEYFVKSVPYLENGKWIFPLEKVV